MGVHVQKVGGCRWGLGVGMCGNTAREWERGMGCGGAYKAGCWCAVMEIKRAECEG